MSKKLSPAERLNVAADFKPTPESGRHGVRDKIIALANTLKGTGVTIKINSALRALDYGAVSYTHLDVYKRQAPYW